MNIPEFCGRAQAVQASAPHYNTPFRRESSLAGAEVGKVVLGMPPPRVALCRAGT